MALNDILGELKDDFVFEESENPDFVLFGPYGPDLPPPGNYTRIGYFCENIIPDLGSCDWAFGVMPGDRVNSPKYRRIQWHGIDPQILVKPANYRPEEILAGKKFFCNFLYSHRVPYREEFFKQLSKYKKVDAPGLSMNNIPGIDDQYPGTVWERKRKFLAEYKFTIAFENYVYPGYQTEKLYDAMRADSLPIYCGDPQIGQVFNTNSFVFANGYGRTADTGALRWLENQCQSGLKDIVPSFYRGPGRRLKRKLKVWGRQLKMHYQFDRKGVKQLVEQIAELDRNDEKYLAVLREPWFHHNIPPPASHRQHWISIFNSRND